jgi:catechol 2,3-dioxygenase-like lactoylglutathione lyase family enzyme
MALDHKAVAILPCNDLAASQSFYERLGFAVTADHGNYRILDDGRGWHLHLRTAEPDSVDPERNAGGLYLYADDVDRVADRVRELIIEPDTPAVKPWGMYEFAVSDPDGLLVRIGRPAS